MSVYAQSNVATRLVPAVPNDFIWRLTIEQYHDMVSKGILTDEDPVELLEGWLVTKMSKNPPHSAANDMAREALGAIVPKGFALKVQNPVTLTESEPEPDILIVRGRISDYVKRHPGPTEVALLVEIADSSIERDRGIKKRVYAAAGIPTYWIVNLIDNRIEVYTEPSTTTNPPDYARRADFGPGDIIPVVIDGHAASVTADSLLP